jgi:GT2 family glycosyltransferase
MNQLRKPSTSIVVSFHEKAHYLDDFLATLRFSAPSAELVLVDDGSTDNSSEIASQYTDNLIMLNGVWETKANNVGLKAASGEYIAVVQDDDIPFMVNWLDDAVNIMIKHKLDILGGRGVGLNFFFSSDAASVKHSLPQYAHRSSRIDEAIVGTSASGIWRQAINVIPGDDRFLQIVDKAIENRSFDEIDLDLAPRPVFLVDSVVRSPLIFKREALEKLSYLDEIYSPLGYDDVDFCYRAQTQGLRCGLTRIPQISKFRSGSVSLYADPSKKAFFDSAMSNNLRQLISRHHDLMRSKSYSSLISQVIDFYSP